MSDVYYHATNKDNLEKVLNSDERSILSVRHLAKIKPDVELSVEYLKGFPFRKVMRAADALEAMDQAKHPDRIFLTKDGYMPNYGDYVIEKQLGNSVKEHDTITSIPEEYTTRRALKIRKGDTIYVPDDEVDEFNKEFAGKAVFKPLSTIDDKKYGLFDRVGALYTKIKNRWFDKEASESSVRKQYGRNAIRVGSTELGMAVPGSSDEDIFIRYKRKPYFDRAIQRFIEKHPDFKLTKASIDKKDKKVYNGLVNGTDTDVVFAIGDKADKFHEAFAEAKRRAETMDKAKIIKKKKDLKNSWFFPQYRYKRYKKQLAHELGLDEAYF